jgi:hypothetical protein
MQRCGRPGQRLLVVLLLMLMLMLTRDSICEFRDKS